MISKADTKLYEQISHTTDSAPYSIHYTHLEKDTEPALYLHWHTEMEFLFLTEGELSFHIEDTVWELHAGEAIFIPSGALHCAKNAKGAPISFYAIVFSPDFMISSLDASYNTYILPVMHNNLQYSLALRPDTTWHKEILNILHSVFFFESKSELFLRGQMLLLWNIFYQNHIAALETSKTIPALSGQLEPAISYIRDNYQQAISLDTLADCVHLSEGQFCRTFKHLTGMTPFQYLIRYRILQSCQELSATNKKITDIATTHGFNNISYYNRAFLKVMNMTPSDYRRQITSTK